ncbi:MAG: hypothetical protein Q8P41_15675 [Pseudomonadota bacterium]|nr:hypothetical protein [Pseudomonadota bacterium]
MWWLLACACPTFEALEVSDRTQAGNATAFARVSDAVDLFAAWTARDGVCLDTVEVVDTIELPEVLDVDGWQTLGVFHGGRRRVEIAAAYFPLAETVTHELCHALDYMEDLAEARPDIFTGEDLEVPEAYPTDELKRAEAFAQACEVGGVDVSIELAYESVCWVEPFGQLLDPTARFLAEEVFPGASRLAVSDAPVALRRRELTLDLPVGGVESVIGTPTDLYALVQHASRRQPRSYTLTLSRLDPDTGAARSEQTLDLPAGYWHGKLLASDGPPLLLVWNTFREDPVATVYAIDGDTLLPLGFTLPEPWNIEGAVFDGVLVSTTQTIRSVVTGDVYLFGGVRAWDLATGLDHPLSFPEDEWGLSVWASGFLPGPDGLEMVSTDGYSRLDLATGTWSRDPSPPYARGLLRLGDKRIHLVSLAYQFEFVVHDLAEDTWSFVEGACEDDLGSPYTAAYAQVGDRAFIVPYLYRGEDGLVAWELTVD